MNQLGFDLGLDDVEAQLSMEIEGNREEDEHGWLDYKEVYKELCHVISDTYNEEVSGFIKAKAHDRMMEEFGWESLMGLDYKEMYLTLCDVLSELVGRGLGFAKPVRMKSEAISRFMEKNQVRL